MFENVFDNRNSKLHLLFDFIFGLLSLFHISSTKLNIMMSGLFFQSFVADMIGKSLIPGISVKQFYICTSEKDITFMILFLDFCLFFQIYSTKV